jgi:hypothetical protein
MQDEDIKAISEKLREIHCIRRIMVEELGEMDEATRVKYFNERATKYFTDRGLPLPKIVDLTGAGELSALQHTKTCI